ncbi:MAG: phytanoyl-CoA dioxygenase family protein [Rhodococcus sp. (in: high G+C Gram-positive bacteria)]
MPDVDYLRFDRDLNVVVGTAYARAADRQEARMGEVARGAATDTSLGWAGPARTDPAVVALREHLDAHGGIIGLEILDPSEIERAVRIFERDGFVVIRDALTPDQTERLAAGVMEAVREIVALDAGRDGNRGSHRYSFGGTSVTRSMLHRPEWQMLVDLPTVTPILTAIFGSIDYSVRSGSGDFCLPGAVGYQPLHSDMRDFVDPESSPFSSFDDRRGFLTTRDLPCPYVCVNFLPFEQTALNGPTRQIPGTQNARVAPPTLAEEPEWMRLSTVCPAPAGSVQIRDVRAWHGGTPNLSDHVRAIPNVEYYAPWFREPTVPGISYADRKKLSEHAQHLTRFVVQDSSEPLETGYSFRPLRGSRPR